MTTHEVLVAARNLIDREGWAGNLSDAIRTGGGHCTVLAVRQVHAKRGCRMDANTDPSLNTLRALLGVEQLGWWNDTPGRTKAEVLAAFDKAIASTAPEPAVPDLSHVEEPVVA